MINYSRFQRLGSIHVFIQRKNKIENFDFFQFPSFRLRGQGGPLKNIKLRIIRTQTKKCGKRGSDIDSNRRENKCSREKSEEVVLELQIFASQ